MDLPFYIVNIAFLSVPDFEIVDIHKCMLIIYVKYFMWVNYKSRIYILHFTFLMDPIIFNEWKSFL